MKLYILYLLIGTIAMLSHVGARTADNPKKAEIPARSNAQANAEFRRRAEIASAAAVGRASASLSVRPGSERQRRAASFRRHAPECGSPRHPGRG